MDPTLILKLRALRGDLDKILSELEAPLKIVTPPVMTATSGYSVVQGPAYTPPQATTAEPPNAYQTGQGLMPNPFVGIVDNVTWREIPTARGPSRLYELHAAGVRMGTFKATDADMARAAKEKGQNVSIVWKTRVSVNGKYTNYDVVSLTVPRGMVN